MAINFKSWRPPAMELDGSPRPCGQCNTAQHDLCDGSSWSPASNTLADCPCGICYSLKEDFNA